MSQAKVDERKKNKLTASQMKAQQQKQKITRWLIGAACIVAVAAIVVLVVLGSQPDYSAINTGVSAFDDAAVAALTGYDGVDLSAALGAVG